MLLDRRTAATRSTTRRALCRGLPHIACAPCSVVRRRLVDRAERDGRRHRLPQLGELALRLGEPVAELADQRIQLADQAVLEGELDLEIEPAFVGGGIGAVGHGATIAAITRRRGGADRVSAGGRPRSTWRPGGRSTARTPRRSGTSRTTRSATRRGGRRDRAARTARPWGRDPGTQGSRTRGGCRGTSRR